MNFDFKPDADIRCREFTIGAVGGGFIMGDVQLAAYANAGFNVKGIATQTVETAKAVADQWSLQKAYGSVSELLDDEEISVVDIAIPPHAQIDVVREAVQRPHIKGVLVQKPMALDYQSAVELVGVCGQHGKVLSVNQNMRFDQSIRVARQIIDQGLLGDLVTATIEMRAAPHWQPYISQYDRLTLLNMSIHHLDALRFLLGEVEGIFVLERKDPAVEFEHHDGICFSSLRFESGAVAALIDDAYAFPRDEEFPSDAAICWRIEGTKGVAKGTIGWPDYPDGSPSTCQFACEETAGEWVQPTWETMWFPHAFAGVMEQLQYALASGTEPALSGADNLKTMALLDAGYRSMKEKRMVAPSEITS